ncbi:hypothetical protein CVT26_015056, partial [Gymnopilus dilepis]
RVVRSCVTCKKTDLLPRPTSVSRRRLAFSSRHLLFQLAPQQRVQDFSQTDKNIHQLSIDQLPLIYLSLPPTTPLNFNYPQFNDGSHLYCSGQYHTTLALRMRVFGSSHRSYRPSAKNERRNPSGCGRRYVSRTEIVFVLLSHSRIDGQLCQHTSKTCPAYPRPRSRTRTMKPDDRQSPMSGWVGAVGAWLPFKGECALQQIRAGSVGRQLSHYGQSVVLLQWHEFTVSATPGQCVISYRASGSRWWVRFPCRMLHCRGFGSSCHPFCFPSSIAIETDSFYLTDIHNIARTTTFKCMPISTQSRCPSCPLEHPGPSSSRFEELSEQYIILIKAMMGIYALKRTTGTLLTVSRLTDAPCAWRRR